MRIKRRHTCDNGLKHEDGTKNADEGPEDRHQIASIDRLLLAVSEEPRYGVWQVRPWWCRYDWLDVAIDVEVPGFVVYHGSRFIS